MNNFKLYYQSQQQLALGLVNGDLTAAISIQNPSKFLVQW